MGVAPSTPRLTRPTLSIAATISYSSCAGEAGAAAPGRVEADGGAVALGAEASWSFARGAAARPIDVRTVEREGSDGAAFGDRRRVLAAGGVDAEDRPGRRGEIAGRVAHEDRVRVRGHRAASRPRIFRKLGGFRRVALG